VVKMVAVNVESIIVEDMVEMMEAMMEAFEPMVEDVFIIVEPQEKVKEKDEDEYIINVEQQEQRIHGLLILRNIIKLIPIYLIRKLCRQLEPAIKF
jgi:hypothetical protein